MHEATKKLKTLQGRIWIVGAGGFGREVYCWVKDTLNTCGSDLHVCGFLDDVVLHNPQKLELLGPAAAELRVESILSYSPQEDDWFVCGMGLPRDKRKVVPPLLERGARFLSIVHPMAVVGENVTLGTGCIICPFAVASTNVMLGDFVTLNTTASYAGHDCRIGSFSTLSPGSSVLGYASVGNSVLLAVNSSVLPHAEVEDDVIIGAGAIVHKFAGHPGTYIGNPARKLEKKSK